MTDLTEDERELTRLVAGYGLACINDVPDLVVSFEAEILAHYRKAKAEASDCPRCAKLLPIPPSKPWPKEPECVSCGYDPCMCDQQ